MPLISDYYCNKCGKVFEYLKYYGETGFPEHPECSYCKSTDTKRKLSCNPVIPDYMKSINN